MSSTVHDYESLAFIDFRRHKPEIVEAFAGTDIVKWYGRMERQLVNLLTDAEKGRNFTYADKLREFLKIWRANEITGSINRETLEVLKAAADVLSVDQWDMAAYFGSLRDQLRVLIASEEQLPRGADMGNEPMAGGMGGGAGAPPMSPSFGPEEGAPGGESAPGGPGGPGGPPMEGPEGAGGAGGQMPGEEPVPGEEEAPGAEPGAPAPEEGTEDTIEPEEMPGGRLGMA